MPRVSRYTRLYVSLGGIMGVLCAPMPTQDFDVELYTEHGGRCRVRTQDYCLSWLE